MPEVILVRHAIAFERNRKRWRNDNLRPLTPGGIKKFRRGAGGLKSVAKRPDRVLTSPLVRARETARILSGAAGWPQARECEELAPGGSPAAVFALLNRSACDCVALVGHEPDLSRLAANALGGKAGIAIEVKKGGALCLDFPGEARAGAATLKWSLPPKVCRALG